jgi:hypothetical protein
MQAGRWTPGLQSSFPAGVPDAAGWEMSSGAAAFEGPDHVVEYELYVSPERGGTYTFTRYRISFSEPEDSLRQEISATEKMQWDVDGRTVRRYECVGAERRSEPCDWREFKPESEEFKRETNNLLLVYALHQRLLRDRDAGSMP